MSTAHGSGGGELFSFFVVGQQIIARYQGRDLYPGRISAAQRFTKRYSILYDDGDTEDNVPLVRYTV